MASIHEAARDGAALVMIVGGNAVSDVPAVTSAGIDAQDRAGVESGSAHGSSRRD